VRIIPGLKDGASLSEALQLLAQTFRAAGIEDADVDARVLAGHALHLDRARLISQSDRVLEAREVNAISGLAARRLKREPVSRILGRKEFWSLALAVMPDVLVPRPETEKPWSKARLILSCAAVCAWKSCAFSTSAPARGLCLWRS